MDAKASANADAVSTQGVLDWTQPVRAPQGKEKPSLVVFSGGTAFNSVAEHLSNYTTRVSHVLPVSDDGGSTAEIVRVLGGPAVGDIRSRCLRLSDTGNAEARAVRSLLAHRLPEEDEQGAKFEWYSIVEGNHELWNGISEPYKHTIRAFLVHFHAQILRHSSERFRFSNGSVGNFFFAGARTFFRSMEAAIFMYARVSGIPPESYVLPSIRGEDRIALGAELNDGTIIRGQNAISHPSEVGPSSPCSQNRVSKECSSPLSSPISRILYLSTEGDHLMHEVFPSVNPSVVERLEKADAVVYGMGSLYTSICPSLILRGVGEVVSRRVGISKFLVLNGALDRETEGMDAVDFVLAVTNALNRRGAGKLSCPLSHPPSAYITTLLYPRDGTVRVDPDRLSALGIHHLVQVESTQDPRGRALYCPRALVGALQQGLDAPSSGSPSS